jgi:hypothetical protein
LSRLETSAGDSRGTVAEIPETHMTTPWHTAWQGSDIVVFRNDAEVDRFDSAQISRVIFVHRGAGNTPGDLVFAVVELPDAHLVLPADTGFAGRVHFERLNFWADKQCVFWAREQKAVLPPRARRVLRLFRPSALEYTRLARPELDAKIDQWSLVGPQTWEQRKWLRIAQSQPFSTTTMPGELTQPPIKKRA